MNLDEKCHILNISDKNDKYQTLDSHLGMNQAVSNKETTVKQKINTDSDFDLAEEFINVVLQQVENLCETIANGDACLPRRLEVNQNLNEAVSCYRVKLLYKQFEIEKKNEFKDEIEPTTKIVNDILQPLDFELKQRFENESIEAYNENISYFQSVIHHMKSEQDTNELECKDLNAGEKQECTNKSCVEMYGIVKPELWCKKCDLQNKLLKKVKEKKVGIKKYDISMYQILRYDKSSKLYHCSICSQCGEKRRTVLRHIEGVHQKEKKNSIKVHSNFLNSEQNEDCESGTCKKLYGRNQLSLWCKECISFQNLPKIKSEKSRKRYQKPAESCPECGISQRNLKLHIRKVHDYEKQKCSVCGKELKNIYLLNHHIKSVHEKITCAECGRRIGKVLIGRHMKTHEKRFPCEVCGKSFGTSQHLTEHMNIHSGKNPYICKFCSHSFSSFGTLRMHERRHEGHQRKCSKKEKQISEF